MICVGVTDGLPLLLFGSLKNSLITVVSLRRYIPLRLTKVASALPGW